MIELKAELSQIPWQMLLIYRVIGSMNGILYVTYHGIDPLEVGQFDTFRPSSCHDPKMKTIGLFNASETGQTIRDNQG